MQKPALAFWLLGIPVTIAMSACQPQATSSSSSQTVEAQDKQASMNATFEVDCAVLTQAMQQIDNKSNIDTIYRIKNQLDACLPNTSHNQVLRLLESYQEMYTQFLAEYSDEDGYYYDHEFSAIAQRLAQKEKIAPEQLAKVSSRLQYLTALAESETDITVQYIGKGSYVFYPNLQAMADVFTPYLQDDQAEFIQRMRPIIKRSFGAMRQSRLLLPN